MGRDAVSTVNTMDASAIPDGPHPIVDKSLNFTAKNISHSTPRIIKVLPNSGSQNATLGVGAGPEVLFNTPATNAIIFGRSWLAFTTTPVAQGANNFTYQQMLGWAWINRLELQTQSGQYLAQIAWVSNITNMLFPVTVPLSRMLDADTGYGTTTAVGVATGMRRTNSLYPTGSATTGTFGIRADGYATADSSRLSYTDIQDLETGSANAIAPVIAWQLPFSYLTGSIFATKQSILFDEILTLRLVFESVTKAAFQALVNVGTPALYAGAVTVSGITLWLAVERSMEVVDRLREMNRRESGTQILLPWWQTYKQNLSGSTQTLTCRMNQSQGHHLKRVISAAYSATETGSTAFLSTNINNTMPGGYNVTSSYSQLDSVRLQDTNLTSADGLDWQTFQPKLKGSAIQNQNSFQYHWCFIDDWTNSTSICEDEEPIVGDTPKDNIIDGISLGPVDRIYTVTANTANTLAANGGNWYTLAQTQKWLFINSQGTQVV